MEQDISIENTQTPVLFANTFVGFLKRKIEEYANTLAEFDHDKRSRWAYAFNPMPDGDPEKPIYASMAALRAPNFAAFRVGKTEGGQVIIEVEYRKLVVPYITNDIENPYQYPKIQNGLRQVIEHFERTAGIQRHNLYDYIVNDPEYAQLTEQRLAEVARANKEAAIVIPVQGDDGLAGYVIDQQVGNEARRPPVNFEASQSAPHA